MAAVELASRLQSSNEPLDVCAQRFSKFVNFLINDFASNSNDALAVEFQDGNLLVTEYGRCRYRDNQLVTLQELPETAPPGQRPHGIDVVLEDDLVDSVKPGDRVAVVGVFRPLAGAANGVVSGVYKSVVVGVAAERLTQDKVRWQPRDVRNIRAVAARPWALQLLARSLAPSIYGHDLVKQGLVLLLMGGIERVVNNTHLR